MPGGNNYLFGGGMLNVNFTANPTRTDLKFAYFQRLNTLLTLAHLKCFLLVLSCNVWQTSGFVLVCHSVRSFKGLVLVEDWRRRRCRAHTVLSCNVGLRGHLPESTSSTLQRGPT